MKQRTIKGASLAQYAIIIALIAIILVPVFYLFGQNIISSFTGLQQGLSQQEKPSTTTANTTKNPTTSTTSTTDAPTTTPTTSSNTNTDASPSNPVKECTGGLCTIDFGDYVLSGIPEDINDFVQSTGSSGTTETLLKALESIIANSDSIQTNADIDLLKSIAEQGHDIADNQKEVEVRAKEMLADPSEPISSGFFTDLNMLNLGSNVDLLNEKMVALTKQLENSTDQNDKNILAIVSYLVDDIQTINSNLYSIGSDVSSGVNSIETYEAVLHPQTSNLTDLDSAIICNTGDGTDTGTECK